MARQTVILVLVLFTIVGFANCADAPAESPKTNETVAAAGPATEGDEPVGNSDESVAGPMPPLAESPQLRNSGPLSAGAAGVLSTGRAATLEVSAITGVAIAAFAGIFFSF